MAEINWRVTAVEFYIVDFRPDSTEMTIRRRSEVDFAIDVRANDFEGLGYYWNLYDRNGQQQEIGDGNSVRIQFDLTGDYDVEGVVWRGNNFDMARCAVTVRSAVWSRWPQGFGADCPVRHDCEADTVTWLIDVIDPHDVTLYPDDFLPASVSLSTPYPNQFNAITRIAYAVPNTGHVKLAVYDISGRMAGLLVDEDVSSGRHVCKLDGSDLAAGLYFVRLEVGGDVLTRKAVVVK